MCIRDRHNIFPKNINQKNRIPVFVDVVGTRCAVGELIFQSGNSNLVKTINKEKNNGYLFELSEQYREIKLWANENGFTLDELALIQPLYCYHEYYYDLGNGGGANGQINVMEVNADSSLLFIAGNFSDMDGISCNNIIAWNGTSWVTLGNGVDLSLIHI